MKKLFPSRKNKGWLFVAVLSLGLVISPSHLSIAADDEPSSDMLEDAASAPPAEGASDRDISSAAGKGPQINDEAKSDDSMEDLEKVIPDKPKTAEASATDKFADLPTQKDSAAEKAAPPQKEEEQLEDLKKAPAATRPTAKPVVDSAASEPPPVVEKIAHEFSPNLRKNQVSNLEFKSDATTSRIVVSLRNKASYRVENNTGLKQLVYFFDNTTTPQRLQRAYDTTEFRSPVSMFTLLQMPGSGQPLTKLIVQLREDKQPTIDVLGSTMEIKFPASDAPADSKSLAQKPSEDTQAVEENIYANGKTYSGKRIERLELKNIDAADALRLITKSSGYNVVIGDDVTGKVGSLSLENIPWDQAFNLVLQSKKLGYIRQGNVLRVGTLASLKSEKDEALANEESRIRVEQIHTLLIPISYGKAADLASRAKNFLTERGKIDTDVRTNTLIVRDISTVLPKIQKLVGALDTQPARVAISAKIMEMDDTFIRNIGFSDFDFNEGFAGININQAVSLTATSNSVTTLTAPNFANLLARFQLGEEDHKVKELANPSVSVVANQAANITDSFSFFIPTTTFANGLATTTFQQITANLTMDVTPIVSADGSIFMTLNIKNDIPNGSGATQTIDSRSVTTQLLVENGDTAVIGGVFKSTVKADRYGVPFLSSIPIVGFFFSSNALNDARNEIYIFLTAKIMNPEEAFKRNF